MTPLAVLDACVLFRIVATDFLLCVARTGVYVPLWSDAIHAEWMTNLGRKRMVPEDRLAWRHARMRAAFPEATVSPDLADLVEATSACLTDAERKDAHVIATALAAGADILVTDNVRDMAAVLVRLRRGPRLLTPDQFVAELYETDRDAVITGARLHRTSMTRPPYDPAAYLALLAGPRAGLPQTASRLAANPGAL